MLQPKRSKHRKQQKGRIREVAKRGTSISFGSFALKALEPIWLTNRQIESARQAMTRAMKREGNVWIRVFPDKIITRKPLEVRMGKGKGNPEFWAAVVEPGRIIFECDGVTPETAKEAMELAAQKLPIKTKFVKTQEFNKSLKDLNATDLKARIQEDQLRLKKLEFAHAISPLENPMNIRGLRRDIARLKTELKKKEMGI
eukprot:jgi/Mesen1/10755/ME000904S10096